MTEFVRRLSGGDPVVGQWLSVGHPSVAEICAPHADFVVVDTEHAPTTLERVADVARAVDAASPETATLARVAWNDHVRIKRALDTGVSGVLVPMVETGEQARDAVEATRYPPEGVRGIAGSRANEYGRTLGDAVASDERACATILQVETPRAVENAPEIAAVDGVDALLVGPADLSGNLDAFGEFESPAFVEAVEDVLDGARAANTPVGTLATDDAEIALWAEYGFDFQIVGTDMGYLATGAENARERFEDAMGRDEESGRTDGEGGRTDAGGADGDAERTDGDAER